MNSTVTEPLQIAVVVGSTRPGRLGPAVAEWFLDRARARSELTPAVVDVGETELPHSFGAPAPRLAPAAAALAAADAFVVVTPEYNHSYPGALKNLIDLHSAEWQAKPVAFVSYGGVSGGLRAVEQLRQVVAELHMVSVRESVSFHRAKRQFDAAGETADGAAIDAAARMLGQLAWWGRALRGARDADPYPG